MKKSIQIFKRDCRRLSRSPLAILVLIGVMILPSLYAWVNIGAYEDPYKYTSGLNVAVASNDKGAYNELAGEINVGEKLISSLKENDSLGWVFTNEKEAIRSVRSGDSYAAIIIPESFSEDLLSITTGELKQPVLEYYSNEKKNAMAPLIMNAGANTLKNQVNQQFVDAAVEAVSQIAQSMIDELGLKLDSLHYSISDDLNSVSDNLAQYNAMSGDLQNLLSDYQAIDRNTRTVLDGITVSSINGRTALDQANRTLDTSKNFFLDFSDSLNRNLSDGETQLSGIRRSSDLDFYDLNSKVQSVNQKIAVAAGLLQEITAWNAGMIEDLDTLSQSASLSGTADLLQRLQQENQSHAELLQALQSGNRALGDAADKTLRGAAEVQTVISNRQSAIPDIRNSWTTNIQEPLLDKINRISWFLGRADGLLDPVPSQVTQMKVILDGLNRNMDEINTTLTQAASMLSHVRELIDNSVADLNLLAGSEEYQEFLNASIDSQAVSGFISSPVTLKTKTFFKVRNYGTAMSPFFTNLAIWVGGMVLISLFRLEVDVDEEITSYRPSEGYLGRAMLFVVVGLAQALTVCLGDLILMKIQCAHPLLFVFSGMAVAFVYVNLIYALATSLKHVGKALCVVILIFQVPSSSGTYPVEMTSSFFQFLNPILPFTYGVNAMREAEIGIYGHHYVLSLLQLSFFLIAALILGLTLRFALINLNVLFDKKLAETDLMICDEAAPEQERFHLMAAVRLLTGRERFAQAIQTRISRFEAVYQERIRQGFRVVLIILPLIFLTLMFATGGSKMLFLILWIISLVALMLFQILIEYFREHLDRLNRMAEMTDQELLLLLNKQNETVKGDETSE